MFNPLYSSTNLIRISTIKVAIIKITNAIPTTKGSHQILTTKVTLFTASKDGWDAKEDNGKWMINISYVQQYVKRPHSKATLNSEKIKPIAVAIVKFCYCSQKASGR